MGPGRRRPSGDGSLSSSVSAAPGGAEYSARTGRQDQSPVPKSLVEPSKEGLESVVDVGVVLVVDVVVEAVVAVVDVSPPAPPVEPSDASRWLVSDVCVPPVAAVPWRSETSTCEAPDRPSLRSRCVPSLGSRPVAWALLVTCLTGRQTTLGSIGARTPVAR